VPFYFIWLIPVSVISGHLCAKHVYSEGRYQFDELVCYTWHVYQIPPEWECLCTNGLEMCFWSTVSCTGASSLSGDGKWSCLMSSVLLHVQNNKPE
jgi:hypothetical protein